MKIYGKGENNPNWKGGKVVVKCANCGKEIYRMPCHIKKHIRLFCNMTCYSEWRKQNLKGEANSFYGKHHSKETKEKISSINKARNYSGENNPNYGNHYSKETRQRISETHKGLLAGDKNPAWKGGRTSLSLAIRNSVTYDLWRKAVFHKDKWQCQDCGQIGRKLHVHHLYSFAHLLDDFNIVSKRQAFKIKELWDINNGITLCKKCHKARHKIMGKYKRKKKTNVN